MQYISKLKVQETVYELKDKNSIHPENVSHDFDIESESPISSIAVNKALNSSNTATQYQNGLMSAADKAKLDATTGITILKLSVVVPSSGWSNSIPYSQSVSVQGIESTDVPVIDVSLSENADTAVEQLNSYARISKIISGNNNITCVCLQQKPLVDIELNLLVVK